jgi:hypothetical protein
MRWNHSQTKDEWNLCGPEMGLWKIRLLCSMSAYNDSSQQKHPDFLLKAYSD